MFCIEWAFLPVPFFSVPSSAFLSGSCRSHWALELLAPSHRQGWALLRGLSPVRQALAFPLRGLGCAPHP